MCKIKECKTKELVGSYELSIAYIDKVPTNVKYI